MRCPVKSLQLSHGRLDQRLVASCRHVRFLRIVNGLPLLYSVISKGVVKSLEVFVVLKILF
jgi:hypothetical protein